MYNNNIHFNKPIHYRCMFMCKITQITKENISIVTNHADYCFFRNSIVTRVSVYAIDPTYIIQI